jgi:hypothetical protein
MHGFRVRVGGADCVIGGASGTANDTEDPDDGDDAACNDAVFADSSLSKSGIGTGAYCALCTVETESGDKLVNNSELFVGGTTEEVAGGKTEVTIVDDEDDDKADRVTSEDSSLAHARRSASFHSTPNWVAIS